jgi:hypothetical protein
MVFTLKTSFFYRVIYMVIDRLILISSSKRIQCGAVLDDEKSFANTNLGDVLNNILLKNQKSYWKILEEDWNIEILEDFWRLEDYSTPRKWTVQHRATVVAPLQQSVRKRACHFFFGSLDSKRPTGCNLIAQILIGGFIIPPIGEKIKNV